MPLEFFCCQSFLKFEACNIYLTFSRFEIIIKFLIHNTFFLGLVWELIFENLATSYELVTVTAGKSSFAKANCQSFPS